MTMKEENTHLKDRVQLLEAEIVDLTIHHPERDRQVMIDYLLLCVRRDPIWELCALAMAPSTN